MQTEQAIRRMVDRETDAWNTQNADALVDIFHPDMVWPWPPNEKAHDPVMWVMPMGRYDRERWRQNWQELFDTHTLVHNKRNTVKVVTTEQQDGGFAVVDVDTLWRHKQTGADFHWKGRAFKVYTKLGSEWKLIVYTGLLEY